MLHKVESPHKNNISLEMHISQTTNIKIKFYSELWKIYEKLEFSKNGSVENWDIFKNLDFL